MKMQTKDWILLIIVLILLIPFSKYALKISDTANNVSSGDSGYPVYINEILASNSLYPDWNGNFCDWIELANSSSSPVDISNFGLTDSPLSIRYTFPKGTVVPPNGYLVVFCSSGGGEGYAPFNISKSGGEEISLISGSNVVVSTVKTVPAAANHPMILDGKGKWVVSDYATPGFRNNEDGRAEYIASLGLAPADLRITEVMASNTATVTDRNNAFSDYIEITNFGENEVSLEGYYLSDSLEKPLKYRLPNAILKPQECILVFASGSELSGDELHAPFMLGSDGETVVLTSPIGETVDSLTYSELESDRAVMLLPDGTTAVRSDASPGYPNTDDGRKQFLASRATPQSLVINEVMTCNSAYLEQPDGEFYDWIELRNCSENELKLSDYYLTDNSGIKDKFRLPEVTLAPGGYYVVICSGSADASNEHYVHAGFSLSAGEDSVYLYDSSSSLIDYAHLIGLTFNGSYGRSENGENGFFYFGTPTPGGANCSGKRFVSAPPTASAASGIYPRAKKLKVGLSGSGEIRYTTDGSLPTKSSALYKEPLELTETTVIRASCFSPDALNGDAATFSYFLSEGHTLPIVSLAVDPDDLWSDETGIYVQGNHDNYHQKWEKYANVSLFEERGSFSINCGLRLHGAGTRETSAKKSFKLCFRPKYDGELHYQVFDNSSINDFSSLLLRGGEDYTRTLFRDELCQSLAADSGDSLLTLNSKYCVLYINGEYFGIFSLREAYSEQYCAEHLNVAPSGVTIIEAPVYETTSPEFYELLEFAGSHSMADEKNYGYIKEHFDIDSLIDWYILETYCGNNDIPGNVRYVYSAHDGKWRYCFFDLDWAFVAKGTCRWALSPNNQHSRMFYALIKNPEFRDRFLSRMAELFNGSLSDKQVLKTIDYYSDLLSPEMKRERKQWGGTVRQWESSVSEVRKYITDNDRQQQIINSLKEYIQLSEQETEHYFGRQKNG